MQEDRAEVRAIRVDRAVPVREHRPVRTLGPIVLLALVLGACAPLPQRAGIPTQWLPSPNHDDRRANFVILHHTSGDSARHSLRTLTDAAREVSAHYLVGRDGSIWQLVDERLRAWHAGESYWGGHTDLNSASLGIELDNNGEEPFADVQIVALLALLRDITTRHRIPANNILGHGDVAPGRKVDPSRHFPWRVLAEHGFGLWCEPPNTQAPPRAGGASPAGGAGGSPPVDSGLTTPEAPPPTSDHDPAEPELLLQALGYDITRPDAAFAAFRRHFRQDDAPRLDADDIALMQCLIRRKADRAHPDRPLAGNR